MNKVWLLYVVRCKGSRKSFTYIHTSCPCTYQSLRCFFENTLDFQQPQIFLREIFLQLRIYQGKLREFFMGP